MKLRHCSTSVGMYSRAVLCDRIKSPDTEPWLIDSWFMTAEVVDEWGKDG